MITMVTGKRFWILNSNKQSIFRWDSLTRSMIARRRRTNSGSDSKQNGISSQTSQTFVSEVLLDTDMSCRDRTNEFFSAAKLLQSRQVRWFVVCN